MLYYIRNNSPKHHLITVLVTFPNPSLPINGYDKGAVGLHASRKGFQASLDGFMAISPSSRTCHARIIPTQRTIPVRCSLAGTRRLPKAKTRGREITVILGAILIDHPKYGEESGVSADGQGVSAGFDMPVLTIPLQLCFSTPLYSSLKKKTGIHHHDAHTHPHSKSRGRDPET